MRSMVLEVVEIKMVFRMHVEPAVDSNKGQVVLNTKGADVK